MNMAVAFRRLFSMFCGKPSDAASVSHDPGKNKKNKVCIIDDSSFITSFVCDSFNRRGMPCDCEYRIPKDISTLEKYGILIVDGSGIGNGTYRNGVEFLMDFALGRTDILIVHYSGLVLPDDKEALEGIGVRVIEKGRSFETVVNGLIELAKERGII